MEPAGFQGGDGGNGFLELFEKQSADLRADSRSFHPDSFPDGIYAWTEQIKQVL